MLTIKNKIEQSVLIKALPFKKNIRKTVPHKHHNYFEIPIIKIQIPILDFGIWDL